MVVTLLDNGKKKKHKKPAEDVPDKLAEQENKYAYTNPASAKIFAPIYEYYADSYMGEIVPLVKIQTAYEMFSDTSWMEKYTTNLYQFSAAKSVDKMRMLQNTVYRSDGRLKSWAQFRDDADEIQNTENKVWLRVERDNCARQAIMADKFTDMRRDADLYPYWIYKGRMDSRERVEHKAIEGLIFRIGDPAGDACYPPSDWNCRCTGRQLDDDDIRKGNRHVQTNEEARGWLTANDPDTGKPFIDPQFRYNPADQGMLPKIGRQFAMLPNANAANADLFGIQGPVKPSLHAAEPLPYLPGLISSWKEQYHVDRLGNICFQNYDLLSNVWFTHHSAAVVHGHPRGSDSIPSTVINPAEVWARWEDVDAQQIVLRNYITFTDKNAFVVQTRQGAIQDAFTVSLGQSGKYRTGVPWIA